MSQCESTDIKFVTFLVTLLKYSLNPTISQQKRHREALKNVVYHLFLDLLNYGLLNMIYFNHIYNHNHILNIITIPILIIGNIIVFISDFVCIRNGIQYDLEILLTSTNYLKEPEYNTLRNRTFKYCAYHRHSVRVLGQKEVEDCPICLDPVNTGNISLLVCGHMYHEKCIKKHETSESNRKFLRQFKNHNSLSRCPKCRKIYSINPQRIIYNPKYFIDNGFLYYQFRRIYNLACKATTLRFILFNFIHKYSHCLILGIIWFITCQLSLHSIN